jgi:excisionase family DNA binding protein
MINTKPQILIVDDEPAICDLLEDDLTEHGYVCTAALDGREAVAKLEKEEFDIVLLDIKMPRMSGLEVLKRIRADGHSTAVIMITCVNSIDTVATALKLGACDYIIKPFDLDEVSSNIRRLLETKKHLPKEEGHQASTYLGREEETGLSVGELPSGINAVAHSEKVVRREQIASMRKAGLTYAAIGLKFGISHERVRQILTGTNRRPKTTTENSQLTATGVARLLNIHPSTARRWADKGILKAYRIGSRQDRRFKREDIVSLQTNQKPSSLAQVEVSYGQD